VVFKMAAEWTEDNTRIITKLFVEQVRLGNRPNTHLPPATYEEVARKFKMLTDKEYKQSQLKNKWDKLKGEPEEDGKNTVIQDVEWWKKAKKDIPGCGKFKKQGLRNEENLKIMFEDITSDGTDHWNPTSGVPPPSSEALADAMNVDDIQGLDNEDTEMQPSPGNAGASTSVKRLGKFVHEVSKKPETAMVMQEQITRIVDVAVQSQSSFESFIRADDASSVKTVMDVVIECGANEGSDEHYIAIELFPKRDLREIFMHMSVGSRLAWLRRKYDHKYPK
ncbi:hypothetical protein BRADI_1g08333v3, partial [Brachypodium distachyon]